MSIRMMLAAAPLIAALMLPNSVSAHVTLDQREAPVGAGLRVAFKVGHGCSGSPTVRLRVRIPDGLIAVKPMPKSGWQIETVTAKYDKPYGYFGNATLTEGVREVVWSGGKLADDHYDEFVISGFLAASMTPGMMLYLPVVQECETGVHRWIEIPTAGKSADDFKEPAPGLKLLPRSGQAH